MLRIAGPCVLTKDERWGPLKGAIEYFQRDAITALHPGATTDIQRVIMARRIGIGGREREKAGRCASGCVNHMSRSRLMDLSLNDTQQLIQDSARDFVRGACGRDVLLELDRNPEAHDAHAVAADVASWAGPAWRSRKQYGGTGNSLTDVAVLFEELGTGPVPGPLFSSAVLCARILLEAAQREP